MPERQRIESQRQNSSGGSGFWDDAGDDGGAATVQHGPYAERLPVAGMTVGQVRDRFRDRFDIDPASQPFLEGEPAEDGTVIGVNQVLTFMHRAGEKGG